MRDNWEPHNKNYEPYMDKDNLTYYVEQAFPGRKILNASRLEGGLTNTNIRITLSEEEDVVLRIIERSSHNLLKEKNISVLIEDIVPSPKFIYINEDTKNKPFAFLKWIHGDLLRNCLKTPSHARQKELGYEIGQLLAKIHSFSFDGAGFFDSNLHITEDISFETGAIIEYAENIFSDEKNSSRISKSQSLALINFLESRQQFLERWEGKPVLVHADFGPTNILVDNDTETPIATGVLDWEFCLSGSALMDIGNLFRPPLDNMMNFQIGFEEGYLIAGGYLHPQWKKMSRIIDLLSWLDFLSRPTSTQKVIQDSIDVIENTIETC